MLGTCWGLWNGFLQCCKAMAEAKAPMKPGLSQSILPKPHSGLLFLALESSPCVPRNGLSLVPVICFFTLSLLSFLGTSER